jgi:hypothetical protein
MDAESSFQVLLSTAALTTALIAVIRVVGLYAASRLPDSPQPASASPSPLDRLRLIAILTAAAMEELETDDLYLTSIVELPEPGGAKHWPRVGKMHFFQKSQYRH